MSDTKKTNHSTDIVLVGCGNMGFAMLQRWIQAIKHIRVHVIEPNASLLKLVQNTGAMIYKHGDLLPDGLDPILVFFAVKPQMMSQIIPPYQRFTKTNNATTFVSIAAGVTTKTISGLLNIDAPIIRCMPNTPASIGAGMLVSFANKHVTASTRDLVDSLLSTNGDSAWVEHENDLDAVTAVSGSGPAYVFYFIECMISAAKQVGIHDDLAKRLAIQTVFGASKLIHQTDEDLAILRKQVTSPGGTTAEGLKAFIENDALKSIVQKAVNNALQRSLELAKE